MSIPVEIEVTESMVNAIIFKIEYDVPLDPSNESIGAEKARGSQEWRNRVGLNGWSLVYPEISDARAYPECSFVLYDEIMRVRVSGLVTPHE